MGESRSNFLIARYLADNSQKTSDPITTRDIEEMINTAVLQPASPQDVARVSARLAAGGWPLADHRERRCAPS